MTVFFSGCYRDFSGKPSTTRLRFALDDIIKSRIFRREQHRKHFIFKKSELPEEDYKDYQGSLVTHRDKLIELPAEALRLVKQIVFRSNSSSTFSES